MEGNELAQSSSSRPLKETLFLTLKDEPSVVDSPQISYHGHIRDDANACWASFPGKYTAGWEALVKEFNMDSVACVFLSAPEDGLGKHVEDEENPGTCYCQRIYGTRDFRSFGYLLAFKRPFSEKRRKELESRAAAMNAVILREDASQQEREEAERDAEERWRSSGKVAAWGCAWYHEWLKKVRAAVLKGQKLKVVFFHGQVGEGKVSMEQLSQSTTNLWDGVGCGGSQKCELATLDFMRRKEGPAWDYEEVDVSDFLKKEFSEGCEVDALHANEWRPGILVRQVCADESHGLDLAWTVRCEKTHEFFDTTHIRHRSQGIEQFLQTYGQEHIHALLRQSLGTVLVEWCDPTRLHTGVPALRVGIRIPDVCALQELRDRILAGELEESLNRRLAETNGTYQVNFDKTRFLELYEDSLFSFEGLTTHQQAKLQEMKGLTQIHLSAPAGAGKTFVAVQYVLDQLMASPSARVLYVAPSDSLGLHFVQWLSTRLSAKMGRDELELCRTKLRDVLSRLMLLHAPYETLLRPELNGDQIVRKAADNVEAFDLIVFDEAHKIFCGDAVTRCQVLSRESVTGGKSKLLLSDLSQAPAVSQRYPNMTRVNLTEVVRSTQCIVAGAAVFRLSSEDKTPVTSLGTHGPPLQTFLFECADMGPGEKYAEYAKHVITALWQVAQSFPGTSLHRRVVLLVPNSAFCRHFKPILQERLRKELPHRRLRLVSFEDSLSSLHERLRGRRVPEKHQQENLILDCVDNADGLEGLVVLCIGLDAAIKFDAADVQTRSQVYRGITRAQLLAMVVNEHVEGGWLEFLGAVKFSKDLPVQRPAAGKAAVQIQERAVHNSAGVAVKSLKGFWPLRVRSHLQRMMASLASIGKCCRGHKSRARRKVAPSPQDSLPQKASPQKVKAVLHRSAVWDTTGNTLLRPTKLQFNPLGKQARSLRVKKANVMDHYDHYENEIDPGVAMAVERPVKLGTGTSGTVWKVSNRRTNAVCALKTVPWERKEQAYEEIHLLASMDHPSIVRLYEVFEESDGFQLVLELCNGGDLFSRVAEARALTELQAARVMKQLLSAVHYLHASYICHRALSPENLLVQSKEPIEATRIKLTGFSRATRFEPGIPLTTPVVIRGKELREQYYVAPELLESRLKHNEQCDMWSCGSIMYMLCCGYPAFFAENEEELFERILGGSYAFLPEDWKQVSDQAKDLIRALMTRNPSRRCTAEQALNNHWINEHSSTGDHALTAETVDNLRSYCRANVIKKLALQVIAMHIGEGSIERQRNQFTSLDFNNNGVISLVEMSVGLEEAPSEVQGIFAGIDFNGSGYIEYTEFLAAALDKRQYLEDKMLAYAFQFFDRDGEGIIRKEDLIVALTESGLEDLDVEQLVAENFEGGFRADLEDPRRVSIDFDMFMAMMRKT